MNEAFDSFRVEEAYAWQDDIMEITRRIVHETDEAWLSNIADHFKVDLSEIREFIEMKRLTKRKAITNADRIRAMSDEELAGLLASTDGDFPPNCEDVPVRKLEAYWLDWLKQEAE